VAYSLEVRGHLDRALRKLAKKDHVAHEAVEKKTLKILEAPYAFRPLHAPMQWKRHVLEDYDHHDRVFRKQP
jgi:DNA-directed RNA polymerase specialized sigma24 family protein